MKQYVSDLKEKDAVNSVFIVRDKTVQVGKNGRPYISMLLSDITGSIDGRIWDNVELMANSFDSGDFVRVKGQVQLYQNRKQLITHGMQKAQGDEYELSDLMKSSQRNPREMYEE